MTSYESDFYAWTIETAEKLRQGKFSEVNMEALIDEVETMGRSEKRELRSRLTVLLVHLLKWQYQPNRRSTSWQLTLRIQRRETRAVLADNPSLKPRLAGMGADAYPSAVMRAALETGFDERTFPATFAETGWTWAQVLETEFLPD